MTTFSSEMEIGTSDNRYPNMCDGAKDKGGKTAIVDCKIPPKIDSDSDGDMYSDSDDSDYDSYKEVVLTQKIHCKDDVWIDADPFKTESKLVQMRYRADHGCIREVESDSITLEMVKEFCEGRAKILDDAAEKENEKFDIDLLNEFNSKFLQDHDAFQLIVAGFDLDIVSLIDLMMPEVVNLFTTKWTEDEVYDFFTVNFKEYHHPEEDKFNVPVLLNDCEYMKFNFSDSRNSLADKFSVMKKDLLNYREFLDFNFSDYRYSVFPNRDVRGTRHWLTTHFLLRRP
ncbi:uncharacterized protein [Rutidosis leptorrhynchoides]|uniref:uncharacterized protein n=1 Tax=Rutidosis leptorrhynchoides TaxID=125765 RepID=UPI003A9A0E81